MATFLNRSNFSGDYGSHFFLDLYYDILSSSSVRFYVYAGSIDNYSASGSGAGVYINNTWVGTLSSLPANSNTLLGSLDVSGSGSVSATASVTTNWNHTGSASVSGSVNLETYPAFTKFDVNKGSNETSLSIAWGSDSVIDYVWYSLDSGSWVGVDVTDGTSGTITVSGLGAGTTHTIKLRIRKKSNQLVNEFSSAKSQTTYNYPYIKTVGTTALTIGSQQTLTIYNPLGRNITIRMYQTNTSGTQLYSGTSTSKGENVSYPFTPTASKLYESIPNTQSSYCVYSVIFGSTSTKTTATNTYSYKITGNERPTVALSVVDSNKSITTGAGTTTTTTLTGSDKKLIKYISDATATATVTPKNSATVKSVSITGNGTTKSGTSTPFKTTFSNVEGVTFSATAKDSRELTPTSPTSANGLTLIPYVKLTLDNVELYRSSPTSNTAYCKGKGSYFNGSFGSASNSLTFRMRYKLSTSSTWGSWTTKQMTVSGNAYTFDFQVGTNFDYTLNYNFQFQVYDKVMQPDTLSITLQQGIPIMGMYEDRVEAFGEMVFQKDYTNSKNVITVYPSTSTTISAASTYTYLTGYAQVYSIGSKLTVNSTNGVVIGKNVHHVLVSGSIYISGLTAGDYVYGAIYRTSSLITQTIMRPNGIGTSLPIPAKMITVSEGDYIRLAMKNDTAARGNNNNAQHNSFLTVEVID